MNFTKPCFLSFLLLAIPALADNPRVLMKTSKGDITIELNSEKAPISVQNFLSYVDDKHYDGTVFHRVIGNFMIQGGGFELKDGTPTEKATKDPIKNERENGLSNEKYTIAMARTGVIDSATSQFFINVKDNGFLDYNAGNPASGYAVFGKVVEGQDVVDAIKAVETGQGQLRMLHPNSGQFITAPAGDVPKEAVKIESVTRVKAAQAEEEATEPAPAGE